MDSLAALVDAWSRRAILFVLAALTVLSIAMHVPGHLSMDSSMQIYEAEVGHSVSWFPPFMSAFLRWLGGGGQATSLFVMTCAIATYGGFALTLRPAIGSTPSTTHFALRALGWLVILLLVINPIVFLHVGIVWKDVLFGALLALALGLMFLGTSKGGNSARLCFLLAGIVLLPAPLVRQQGMILVPILLIPCIVNVAGIPGNVSLQWGRSLIRLVGAALLYVALFLLLNVAVDQTISGSGNKSTSVGIVAIQRYDIAGMLASGATVESLPDSMRTSPFLSGVQRTYHAARLDHVMAEPSVVRGLQPVDARELHVAWVGMIQQQPWKYVSVKSEQYAWLIGMRRLDRCLPIHVGVEGNREFLAKVGIPAVMDDRDHALFRLSDWSTQFPLYRHWFYIVVFLVCAGALVIGRERFDGNERLTLTATISAIVALYGSFLPTVLACDFRYLYPGLLLVSLLAVYTVMSCISSQTRLAKK